MHDSILILWESTRVLAMRETSSNNELQFSFWLWQIGNRFATTGGGWNLAVVYNRIARKKKGRPRKPPNEAPNESVTKLFASAQIRLMSLASQVPEYHVAPVSFTRLPQVIIQSQILLSKDTPMLQQIQKANLSYSLTVDYPSQWTRVSQECSCLLLKLLGKTCMKKNTLISAKERRISCNSHTWVSTPSRRVSWESILRFTAMSRYLHTTQCPTSCITKDYT